MYSMAEERPEYVSINIDSDDDMQAVTDTMPPTAESVILPSHQHTLESENRVSSHFPIQFTDKFDRSVDFYDSMESNSGQCLYMGISTADHSHDTFEWDSQYSVISLCGVVNKQWKIAQENIVILSPFDKLDSDKIKNTFESVKRKHSEAPYTAVFLHIVGHAPKCDNEGFYQFDVGNDCFVRLNEIKMLLANFASCSKIIIVKDFCSAEAYDLLPNLPTEPKQVRVQWSACAKDGEAYKSKGISGRLFSNCLAAGFDGQECPNNIRNCDVCEDYRSSVLQRNVVISYNILKDKWVIPHMRQCTRLLYDVCSCQSSATSVGTMCGECAVHTGINDCDYPVLNIHESCQEMFKVFNCSLL